MVARTLFTSIYSLFNLIDVYEKQLFSRFISFAGVVSNNQRWTGNLQQYLLTRGY